MIVIKNNTHQLGNSLVIQCLRLERSLPRDQVQSLAWELRSHKPQGVAKNQPTNQNKQTKNFPSTVPQSSPHFTWFWRRLLRVPWTARRSNQSILKEIIPEYSLDGLHWNSSILVIWWEQLTQWKSPWCWERLKAEGEEGVRGWDDWMTSLVQWTWTWANFRRWWRTEAWHAAVHGVPKSQTWLGDWTTAIQKVLREACELFWFLSQKPGLEETLEAL